MAAVTGDDGVVSGSETADVEGPESGSDAGEPAVPTFDITFGEGQMGMLVKESSLGLMVVHIKMDGAAMENGVKIGYVVTQLNDEPVPPHMTEAGFAKKVGAAARPLTMRFTRPPEAADELAALIALSN